MKSYGCHNLPRPTETTTHPAQDGWFYDASGMTRKPRIVQIQHVMTTECRYDKTDTDPCCAGCVHIPT